MILMSSPGVKEPDDLDEYAEYGSPSLGKPWSYDLLPLPALDGGRLMFLLVEAIRRKPINRQVEDGAFCGLMLLMALMVVVMYNDILKIF